MAVLSKCWLFAINWVGHILPIKRIKEQLTRNGSLLNLCTQAAFRYSNFSNLDFVCLDALFVSFHRSSALRSQFFSALFTARRKVSWQSLKNATTASTQWNSRNTRNTESNSASKCMWAAMPLGNIWWHQWPLTNTQVPTIMFWCLPTSQTSLLYSVKGVMNSNFGKSNCNFCKINFGNSNCNFGKLQANRVPWGMTVAPPAPPSMGVHTCQGWVG